MPKCKKPSPVCPHCEGPAQRIELQTRPVVYACDACHELFTRSNRVPDVTLRQRRRALIQRWDQLADDVHLLVQAMETVPAGVYGDDWQRAIRALDQDAWDVFVNSRPRLPGSPIRRARDLQAAERRRQYEESLLAWAKEELPKIQAEAERLKNKAVEGEFP